MAIKGSAAVKPEVKEKKDGSLEVSYTAPMSGEYRVAVALGNIPVPGSPFRVPCQQPRACEQRSRVEWGSGQAFAGEPYTARMTAFDQFGQRYSADPRCRAPSKSSLPCPDLLFHLAEDCAHMRTVGLEGEDGAGKGCRKASNRACQ